MAPIDAWDNQEAYFIDKIGFEECPVDVAASFEQQCADSEVLSDLVYSSKQVAQELSQLRRGVVTQLGFLGREFGSRALDERICGAQDVIKQREGRFNLEVMGSAAAASRLLVESPALSDGKVSRARPSAAAQAMSFNQYAGTP